MKALLSVVAGGPGQLEIRDIAPLVPEVGEVVVEVRAASLNYPDLLIIEDRYQARPERPFSPGGEAAGIVVAVGADVSSFRCGDRVAVFATHGALAEQICVPQQQLVHLPDDIAFDDAATLLITYGTAYHALMDRAGLVDGETLLVLGAAGGVGAAAVELGRVMGARVIAVASSDEKLKFARECGAQEGVLYPRSLDEQGQRAFAGTIKRVAGSVDIVFDPVGGCYAEPALRSLGWRGRYLVVGFAAGIPTIPLNLTLLKGCRIDGIFWGAFAERERDRHLANMESLFSLLRAGRIRPRISARYPLGRAADALEVLARRGAMGKILISGRHS